MRPLRSARCAAAPRSSSVSTSLRGGKQEQSHSSTSKVTHARAITLSNQGTHWLEAVCTIISKQAAIKLASRGRLSSRASASSCTRARRSGGRRWSERRSPRAVACLRSDGDRSSIKRRRRYDHGAKQESSKNQLERILRQSSGAQEANPELHQTSRAAAKPRRRRREAAVWRASRRAPRRPFAPAHQA